MPKPDLKQHIAEILEKHARGACTPEEEQFLIEWYNNIGDEKDIDPDIASMSQIRQRIWSRINPLKFKKQSRSWPYKVAAIIVFPVMVAIGLYTFWPADQHHELAHARKNAVSTFSLLDRVVNDGPEARRVTLKDGSVITLQRNSEIQYASAFNSKIRAVRLKGEAFFDITPDPNRPFMVYANEVVTKVLGTSFNIRAYDKDEEITVSVKTGRVSVYTKSRHSAGANAPPQNEVILTPNQKIVFDRHNEVVSKQLVEEPEIILPESSLFAMQFEGAPVPEILDLLAESYGVDISFDKTLLKNCRLTTSMSDEGLYERIEVICKAIGASYTIEDAVIIITSSGC